MVADKIVPVVGVLEKHFIAFSDRRAVQGAQRHGQQVLIGQGVAPARDVADLPQPQGGRRHGAVDIRLGGVAEDDIRLYVPHDAPVLRQQLQILGRVQPPAGHGRFDNLTAELAEIRVLFIRGQGEHHAVPKPHQSLDQLPAEGVERDKMIGEEEDGFILFHADTPPPRV